MTHLDGNVLAGQFSDVFTADVTRMRGRCAQCGDQAMLAEAMVYLTAMGAVARCRRCSNVLVTLVDTPRSRMMSMSGLTLTEIAKG